MLNVITGLHSGGVAASTSAYESIATATVGSGGSSSISFSSIPSTYTHLQIRLMTLTSGVNTDIVMRFNGDTGNNYSQHYLYGGGAGSGGSGGSGSANYAIPGILGGTSAPSSGVCDILDYKNTSKYKTVRAISGDDQNGSGYLFFYSSAWLNTSAISSITITPGAGVFNQYCHFALYGVK